MIQSLLIANRGEIACRIARTARAMGVRTIAVYSDADRDAPHVKACDEAHYIGPSPANESYLLADVILDVAKKTGAEAVHPGFGFLSENADFAEACAKAGVIFVGPSAHAIRAMGEKDRAKALMQEAGVPVVPGYFGDNQDEVHLSAEAEKIGYPVLIKAALGGGGKGMRKVDDPAKFLKGLQGAKREAMGAFGDDRVLIEKWVTSPRHIEVQIFGWPDGRVDALFERDCSLQRRHQKVIEEAPAPGMTDEMRAAMCDAAVKAAKAVDYVGAGTVEFIVDGSKGLRPDGFWFMEMNTRLQVEHPVTEEVTGVDLVRWQLMAAAGESRAEDMPNAPQGWSFEARLYAEDPQKKFLPSVGRLTRLAFGEGEGVRIETGVAQGGEVSMFYDPMIAKVIATGQTRDEARQRLVGALKATRIAGPKTNQAFLIACLEDVDFASGNLDTGFIEERLAALTAPKGDLTVALQLAALWRLANEETQSTDPWDHLHGFRVNGQGNRVMTFKVGEDEHVLTATYTSYGYDLGDGPVQVQRAANGLRSALNGKTYQADIVLAGDVLSVLYDGCRFDLTLIHPFDVDSFVAGVEGGDAVTAPMPGKVIHLNIRVGDQVVQGQDLGVLEAMKMEHTLTAPRDGVVASIAAKAGDQVAEGATLIALEEA
ncbi:MAG: acetyl/propionyl/methylcrotonyl-CoA carboxylase subunit alpha [Alphaproteobacteria bacterium]